jgi:hypothetical protein
VGIKRKKTVEGVGKKERKRLKGIVNNKEKG